MKDFKELEQKTHIEFTDKSLLKQAFIHRSYINENKGLGLGHNERLEFLGDAVLELVITHFLFHTYADEDEGVLEAELTAAVKPAEAQVKSLIKQLEAKFGKKIEAEVKVDPELIGGIKIVVGDTVIDASVRGQLQSLEYALKS